MMKKMMSILVVGALLAVLGVSASAANLLADPNMDTGDGAWSRLTGHVWWASWVSLADGQTPSNYLLTFKDAPADETTQVVAAVGQTLYNPTPGTYTASIYYRMHPGNPATKWDGPGGADQWAGLHFDTQNAAGTYTTWQESQKIEYATTDWTLFTTQFVIPDGTTQARFWMQSIFVESWAMVDWDTASLNPVPEPSSLVVLFGGLASLAGFARRRK